MTDNHEKRVVRAEGRETHGNLVKDEVHEREDDRHSERVRPHPDDRHDVGVSVVRLVSRYPAKDGEDTCEDVDTEDGADELPGGPRSRTTSDEDQPILEEEEDPNKFQSTMRRVGKDYLGQSDLQEEDFLH